MKIIKYNSVVFLLWTVTQCELGSPSKGLVSHISYILGWYAMPWIPWSLGPGVSSSESWGILQDAHSGSSKEGKMENQMEEGSWMLVNHLPIWVV